MDRPQVDRRMKEIITACGKSSFRRWRVLKQLEYPMFFRWMTDADRATVRTQIKGD